MYYVYLLRRRDRVTTYIGYTKDLARRMQEHSKKGPELLYYEAYKNETDARTRERMLKQRGQAARRLKERLRHGLL